MENQATESLRRALKIGQERALDLFIEMMETRQRFNDNSTMMRIAKLKLAASILTGLSEDDLCGEIMFIAERMESSFNKRVALREKTGQKMDAEEEAFERMKEDYTRVRSGFNLEK